MIASFFYPYGANRNVKIFIGSDDSETRKEFSRLFNFLFCIVFRTHYPTARSEPDLYVRHALAQNLYCSPVRFQQIVRGSQPVFQCIRQPGIFTYSQCVFYARSAERRYILLINFLSFWFNPFTAFEKAVLCLSSLKYMLFPPFLQIKKADCFTKQSA